ncbi:shikimate kinase [Flavobacteriaceae bacterium M23B6Z8]
MIILIGYMGSGKSTLGKVLASELQKEFFDLDALIEEREQHSIRDIFEKKGEIYFRKLERKVLEELLNKNSDIILSLGGGTPCFGDNTEIIKKASQNVFYLKLSVQELTKRLLKEKEDRPLISHLKSEEALEDFVRKHLFERNFYYLQAHHVLNADAKLPEELAQEITALL